MASIQKKKKGWRVFVYLPGGARPTMTLPFTEYPDSRDGRRRAQLKADQWQDELLTEKQERERSEGDGATVLDLCDRWYDEMIAVDRWASVRTAEKNRRQIDRWIAGDEIGSMVAADLRVSDFTRFYKRLGEKKVQKAGPTFGQPLSAGTIRVTHGVLKAVFTYAFSQEWTSSDYGAGVTAPKGRKTEMVIPTREQVAMIFVLADGPKWQAYVRLAFSVGMRRSNILGIKWSDLSVVDGNTILTIARGVTYAKGQLQVKNPKSERRWSVTLDADTARALDELHKTRRELAGVLDMELPEDSFVFHSPPPKDGYDRDGDFFNKPMHPSTVSTWWDRIRGPLKDKGPLANITLHSWRHYAASRMYADGFDDVAIANRLGHSSPNTTRAIYAHMIPARDSELADAIGAGLPELRS